MYSKKIISQFVLIILFNFQLIYAQEQLKDWAVPPYYLSGFPNPAVGNLPLSSFPTNVTRYFNGVYTAQGTPEFYVVDDILYSSFGPIGTNLVGLGEPCFPYLNDPSSPSNLDPGVRVALDNYTEIPIIPIPGNYDQYYIILPGAYQVYDACSDYIDNCYPLQQLSPRLASPSSATGSNRYNYAVSKEYVENAQFKRLLFVLHPNSHIQVYEVTVNGITFLYDFDFQAAIPDFNSLNIKTEMECINISQGVFRVAVPYSYGTGGCPSHPMGDGQPSFGIAMIDFTLNNGSLSHSFLSPLLMPETDPDPCSIYKTIPAGLEFSPSGEYLYYTIRYPCDNQPAPMHHIYIGEVFPGGSVSNSLFGPAAPGSGSFCATSIATEFDFKHSMIELAYDVDNTTNQSHQRLYFNAGNRLAYLDNPNDPTLACLSWVDNAITFPTAVTIKHNQPCTGGGYGAYTGNIHSLPDQIDGENYDTKAIAMSNPVVVASNDLCNGGSAVLLAHGGYGSFLWSTGATTQSITVTTPGTYTVTVTDCFGSHVYSFTAGCCTNYAQEFPYGSTGIIVNSSFNANNNITIANGSSLTLDACNVEIYPGGQIFIEPNATLHITNTSLINGCVEMWKGILLLDPTSTLIIEGGTQIQDAFNAIQAPNGGNIILRDGVYDKNLKALNISNGNYSSAQITGNTFKCTDNLKPPLNARNISQYQIKLENVIGLEIGAPWMPQNDFRDAEFGIFSESSDFNVFNNSFNNMINTTPQNLTGGIGVFANRSQMLNIGTGIGYENSFTNCPLGVWLLQCNDADVVLNNFNNCQQGVFAMFNVYAQNITISDNIMNNMGNGIASFSNFKTPVTIINNRISVISAPGYSPTGIYATDWFFNLGGDPSFIDVQDNVIHSRGWAGVYLYSTGYSRFRNNRVYMDHTGLSSDAYGFKFDETHVNEIECNEVDQVVSDARFKTGFSFFDALKNTISCNYSLDNETGMQFIGRNENALIAGNEMHNATDALLVGDKTTTVATTVTPLTNTNTANEVPNNKWYGNLNDTHTYYQGSAPDLWAKNGQGNPDYPTVNSSTGGAAINPFVSGLNLYQPCATCNIPTMAPPDDSGSLSLMVAEQIAQSQLPIMNMDLVAAWKAKKALYKELSEDAALLNSSTVLQSFYATTATENIGALTAIEEAMEAALDTIIEEDTTAQDSLRMQAININNNIVPDLLPEYNQRVVNSVYLNSFARKRYILTQQELADAMMVANQCVYDGGPAVLSARLMVHTQYPFYLFNDADLCGGANAARIKSKDKDLQQKVTDIKLYPNPAIDRLLIELPVSDNGIVSIFDLYGKLIFKSSFNEQFLKISLQSIPAGFYNLIINGNSSVYQNKFEIVK